MPERGDLIIFSFPKDITQQYLNRVVGLPGDTITYRDKKLTINSRPVRYAALSEFLLSNRLLYVTQADEYLAKQPHRIVYRPETPSFEIDSVYDFPHRATCTYANEEFTCKVPAASYFVVGDSRDDSMDSRYWGYVPADYIIGKVWMVWANLSDMGRVGPVR